jgi:hypothetical protein
VKAFHYENILQLYRPLTLKKTIKEAYIDEDELYEDADLGKHKTLVMLFF